MKCLEKQEVDDTLQLVSCKFRLAQKLSRKFKYSLSQNPRPILSENLYEY